MICIKYTAILGEGSQLCAFWRGESVTKGKTPSSWLLFSLQYYHHQTAIGSHTTAGQSVRTSRLQLETISCKEFSFYLLDQNFVCTDITLKSINILAWAESYVSKLQLWSTTVQYYLKY